MFKEDIILSHACNITTGGWLTMQIRYSLNIQPFIIVWVLGSVFILTSLISFAIAINTMRVQQSYKVGQCTITAKHLLHSLSSSTTNTGSGQIHTTSDVYAPSFEFTVRTADGRSYTSQGYDGLNIYTSDLASQQAILNRYNVGQTYQCWYDPSQPAQAILVRGFNWLLFVIAGAFLIPGIVLTIVGFRLFRSFRRRQSYTRQNMGSYPGENSWTNRYR
jgi:hypothetical protein